MGSGENAGEGAGDGGDTHKRVFISIFLAMPGLSYSTQGLRHAGSLAVVCGSVPCPGMEPGPLYRNLRILATGLPWKSLN